MIMSNFTLYVKLPAYEREWCIHHFGNPCVFPAQSNINAVIRHFLRLRPKGAIPELQQSDELAVVIPQSQSKPPQSYNFLTKAGKAAVSEAINDLFTMQMWESLTDSAVRSVAVTHLIEDFMENNGISWENFHNLKQKFTRIKDSYRKHGINVSRGYKHENLSKNTKTLRKF